jgi:LysM repeat protein
MMQGKMQNILIEGWIEVDRSLYEAMELYEAMKKATTQGGHKDAAAQHHDSTSPAAGPGEYVVQSGDSGATIARAAGIGLRDLMEANTEVDWNRLRVGQVIKLPRRD